jgi:hypothetical protein
MPVLPDAFAAAFFNQVANNLSSMCPVMKESLILFPVEV